MTAKTAPDVGTSHHPHAGHPLFHPDLRENHRFLAACFAQLAQFVADDARGPHTGADDRSYLAGYRAALVDLSHHLSTGDYLPGGMLNCVDLPA